MKVIKYTVTISAEALTLDAIAGLVREAMNYVSGERISGEIFMDDGDNVRWNTEKKEVDF